MRFSLKCLFVVLLVLFLPACNFLRVKEVMEGDDTWVRELTQGMDINTIYPHEEVVAQQPWEYTVLIENHGEHEPHLNTARVEEVQGKQGLTCKMLEPQALQVSHDGAVWSFALSPSKVERHAITTIKIQCRAAYPGTYQILWAFEFRESGIAFLSDLTTLRVRSAP